MKKKIKIIDLFAGPGGLGEGFSNCKPNSPFEIAMSVECDKNAHKTLTHRAFYRKLKPRDKKIFLEYIRLSNMAEKTQFLEKLKIAYPTEWMRAVEETLGAPHALGNSKIWVKLKNGEKITQKDREDTPEQVAISKRIKVIKKQCVDNNEPLIVIGGPPCQSYSNARSRLRAIEGYNPDEDQRFYLYREYCRVLYEAEPDLFVMENVKGILSAKNASDELIFPIIRKALEKPGSVLDKKSGPTYKLYPIIQPEIVNETGPNSFEDKDFNVKADEFGVPQARHRIIIIGIRTKHLRYKNKDIRVFLKYPRNLAKVSIADVIDSMPRLRSGITPKQSDTSNNWVEQWNESRNLLITRLDKDKYGEVINILKETKLKTIALSKGDYNFINSGLTGFSESFLNSNEKIHMDLQHWIYSRELHGFANHTTKSHQILDRQIYMFAAAYAKAHKNDVNPSPTSKDFPGFLAPNHESWEKGDHADRFRCLEASKVSKTITSHLKKDGHAFIHYDITQNRSLTPREAARIQSFPDDYFFEGAQGSQYHQIGNAVPPFLAKGIAIHVYNIMKRICSSS